jgi:SAM-dependent methyltransferase
MLTLPMQQSHATSGCCAEFAAQYDQQALPAMRALERDVLGCDYGGTSWTTRSQADGIPGLLGLGHQTRLLEIGSGSGWPGLYVAQKTRCHVTLLEMPLNALEIARDRAVGDGLEQQCDFVAASGADLPFRDASFSALSHSDVLCCLPEKRELLAECRRVATDGALMLFYVIAAAENLNAKDLGAAVEVGPPFVESEDNYVSMLGETGWRIRERVDLTQDYLRSLTTLVDGLESNPSELIDAIGREEYREQLSRRRQQVDAVRRGLLVREMYLADASRPGVR